MTYRDALPRTADVVVIGGGVVGAATAFHACRAGLRTLLIERRPRLCTLTTPASTGAFRLQFDSREELELVRRSVELFLNFADVTHQQEYELDVRQQGYLFVTADAEGRDRQRRLVTAQHGWGQTDVELFTGEEARDRFPYLSNDVISARFRAGDGFLDPKQLTMGLAIASGADILTACSVTGFRLSDSRLSGIETEKGTISTEHAVIAA
ncbi:MAG TPA: FAD-dependent oxidoreductase, partial [Anaerolineales bacterium]